MQIASTRRAPALKPYIRQLKEGEKLGCMGSLIEQGLVRSYSQEGDTVTIYSTEADAVKQLPIAKASRFDLKEKIIGFVKPEQMERDCSREYKSWRKWNLAASTLNGVIGFMATSVFLDAQNASYSNSEAVAMSGVITGTLGKVTQMAASPLARFGDSDPKKSYLRSNLISTASSSAALGVLGAIPAWHFPVFCGSAIAGTVGSTIGAAAGANIFSHLVPGPTKGDVTNKNSNQELIASLWGMPVGLALGKLARTVGLPPGVLGACLLGPVKAFCHIQAARALQMNPAGADELAQIAESFVQSGLPIQAPTESVTQTIKGLFSKRAHSESKAWPFTQNLQQALGKDPSFTLDTFAGEKYLLSVNGEGRIAMGLAEGAKSEDALRAVLHHTLLEKALKSQLPEALAKLKRSDIHHDLVEITKRALPEPVDAQALLARNGWHLSLKNLGIPLLAGGWKAPEEKKKSDPISLETIRRLTETEPDSEVLLGLLVSGR